MMTVYIVTRGRYDDYEIVEVFATNEQAEAFEKQEAAKEDNWWWRNDYRVESWPVTEAKKNPAC